ncbi:T9SS type A sorting domain-containing protein [Tenacibaculum sp. M341]|uniref:T9SS type A sorting domain-containing protein n=1 Tax=Tenacibaculum sp. M341 TaxID=2530339 RepID=UPI00104C7767|nr:T9SS type A sorting domain-containing protein [Tenacibaculum sp. M341]TCI90764.1 T9SS type A sorting domain-containing protein [Tenacibaculum sp. M341]
MKNLKILLLFVLCLSIQITAQNDWDNISIPANAGDGKTWEIVESLSDDFNYSNSFSAGEFANRSNFGPQNQWYNFYHNQWDGPGYTYWDTSNVAVDGTNLVITVGQTPETTKGGAYGVASGCVTSNAKVTYPVYVESSISVANISLASCFWLLSPDDTEEIDIIENYGGVDFFKNFTHISHHSFVRNPFTDYQPRDWNSWYPIDEITQAGGWGEYCWNGGNRRYMRMGVNWIGPKHWEYYIDGNLVRVMYYNAMATKIGDKWEYTYYKAVQQNANGYYFPTNRPDGYSDVTIHTTTNNYSLSTLQNTSNASKGFSVIDPGWFQGGDDNDVDQNGVTVEPAGFTKELDIIINMESQGWLLNSTPSVADLNDPSKNKMLVDWVRVYTPITNSSNNASVSCNNLPSTITAEKNYTFDVSYEADTTRDIVIEFWESGVWKTNGVTTVNAGSSTATVSVNLEQAPAAGSTILLKTSIRPVGGNFTTSIDNCETTPQLLTSDNTFFIINKQTNGKISANGTTVFSELQMVANSSNSNSAKWTMIDAGNGYFFLKNVATNLFFRPLNNSNSSIIQQVPNTFKGNFTQWKKVPSANGYFYLQNRQTGMYFRPTTNAISSSLEQRPTNWSGNYTQWIFKDAVTGNAFNKTVTVKQKIQEIPKQQKFSVFPNPSNGLLTITGLKNTNEVFKVVNLLGATVKEINTEIQNGKTTINLNNLETGSYFLLSKNQKLSKRIIINK